MIIACMLGLLPTRANAATLLNGLGGAAGYGTNVLPANDDLSSPSIDLSTAFPTGLNYFGTAHHIVFVNNNGNATFGASSPQYLPVSFPTLSGIAMIAPWLADVDTRSTSLPTGAGVYWDVRPGQFVATWFEVSYFAAHSMPTDSFQLILLDRPARAPADFDIELRYAVCDWTTGDSTGGFNGLGGTQASAGFDGADGVHGHELPGSRTAAVMNLCTATNAGMPGLFRFQFRLGVLCACGDGVLCSTEACDDGNFVAGDGCSPTCEVEPPNGAPCTGTTPCRSGHCADGVCCDTACAGECEACNVAASPGTCVPVVGAPHGARPVCAGPTGVCGAQCDGVRRDACIFPAASHECGPGGCSGGVEMRPSHCDGAGACVPGERAPCIAYTCSGPTCRTHCAVESDCAPGFDCVAGACVLIADAGNDGGTDAAPAFDGAGPGPTATGPTFRGGACECAAVPGDARTSGGGVIALAVVVSVVGRRRRCSAPSRTGRACPQPSPRTGGGSTRGSRWRRF
jgi:cysteine-rich repeat protein